MAAGGALLFAAAGLSALLAATGTESWLRPRGRGDAVGLWRVCTAGGRCGTEPGTAALWVAVRVLLLLAVLAAALGFLMGLSAAGAARRERGRAAGISMGLAGLLALLALSLCSVVTRGSAWSFSWSYILGWVGVVLISSAGLFHLCAATKDPTPESSESGGG